jgi:hypothetical protein
MTDKSNICDLVPTDVDNMEYHLLPKGEKWKLSIIREIIEKKNGNIVNLTEEELDNKLEVRPLFP